MSSSLAGANGNGQAIVLQATPAISFSQSGSDEFNWNHQKTASFLRVAVKPGQLNLVFLDQMHKTGEGGACADIRDIKEMYSAQLRVGQAQPIRRNGSRIIQQFHVQ